MNNSAINAIFAYYAKEASDRGTLITPRSVAALSQGVIRCPRVLQAWVRGRSPPTSDAGDAASTHSTRLSQFVLAAGMDRLPR